jgi:hypothetical protein
MTPERGEQAQNIRHNFRIVTQLDRALTFIHEVQQRLGRSAKDHTAATLLPEEIYCVVEDMYAADGTSASGCPSAMRIAIWILRGK